VRRIAWPQWTGFRDKTLWRWLELLGTLAVPIVVALVGVYFAAQQSKTQNNIEQQRAQAAAFQAYLDQLGSLLLKDGLRESEEGSEERTLARARTLTVLDGLDPDRKGRVLQFLNEANLINPKDPVLDLSGADVTNADLSNDYLGFANLRGANLREANLREANLESAELSRANLSRANLSRADLSRADLSEAILTDVQGLSLTSYAPDSERPTMPDLEGATMPNGQQMPIGLPERGQSRDAVEIEPGVYTTDEFQPRFAFKVDKGWEVLRPETGGEISILRPETVANLSRGGSGGELILTNPQWVYAQDEQLAEQLKQSVVNRCLHLLPNDPIKLISCPPPKTVDDWISWFQNNPKLETSKPVAVSVAGVSGKRIDVKVNSEPKNVCEDPHYPKPIPCVPLFITGYPPNGHNTIGSEFTTFDSKGDFFKDRFVIVDVEGETVVIKNTILFGQLDQSFQIAQKVLDTVEWKPRSQRYVDWLKSEGSGEDRQNE
jgi:hypothetical protein